MQIQPYEGDGLSVANPSQKTTQGVKFDGKDYAIQGADLPAGYTCSAHRPGERSIEMTHKFKSKLIDSRQVQLSADSQILTVTVSIPGQSKPDIIVFDRE